MKYAAEKFLLENSLKSLLNLPAGVLEVCFSKGRALYRAGQYGEAEVLARGLVAADHSNTAYRVLLAGSLHKLGRSAQAVRVVEEGLRHFPGDRELASVRAALLGH